MNERCASVTKWDGKTEFYWREKFNNQSGVEQMLSVALRRLTNAGTDRVAWADVFKYFNAIHEGQARDYRKGEKVALKINLNTVYGQYADNNGNGLTPQFLKAVLRQLVNVVGVQQEDICLYDAARWIPPSMFDAPEGSHKEFPRVHFVDNAGQLGREKVVPDPNGHLYFSDKNVPAYDVCLLPTCVTQAKYVVLIDNFRGHDMAGVTLSGKNWFGSIYRPDCVCGAAGPVRGHLIFGASLEVHPLADFAVVACVRCSGAHGLFTHSPT